MIFTQIVSNFIIFVFVQTFVIYYHNYKLFTIECIKKSNNNISFVKNKEKSNSIKRFVN